MLGLADGPPPAGHWRRVASAALAKFGPDGARLPVPPAPFDVLVEVHLPGTEQELPELVRRCLREALGPATVDPARSAILAGLEYRVLPGSGAACAVGLIRRHGDLSPAEFTAHWRDRHVEFARRVSGANGYRQVHAESALSAVVAAELGLPGFDAAAFDGAGLLYFADLAAMSQARSSEAVRRAATEDEMRFVDHARSHFFAVSATHHPGRKSGRTGPGARSVGAGPPSQVSVPASGASTANRPTARRPK